jgi:hypothetical protein
MNRKKTAMQEKEKELQVAKNVVALLQKEISSEELEIAEIVHESEEVFVIFN